MALTVKSTEREILLSLGFIYYFMVEELATRSQTHNLIGLLPIAIGFILLILSTTQFVTIGGISTILNSPLADALWGVGLLMALAGEAILMKRKAYLASSAIITVSVWLLVLFIMISTQRVI